MNPLQDFRQFITRTQRAYQQTFLLPAAVGKQVLADLAKFCFAHEPTLHADARVHAFNEGKRAVWLHIQRRLKLSEDELWKLYGKEKDL